MKRVVTAVALAGLLMVPGLASAGSSTEAAALGLGAFAVFNQILSGTGVFGIGRPPVVEQPVYAPAPPVVYAPAPPPVYAPAPPVVYAPAPPPVYAPAPPVVYAPAPVPVYAPAPPVVYAPGYRYARHADWHRDHRW